MMIQGFERDYVEDGVSHNDIIDAISQSTNLENKSNAIPTEYKGMNINTPYLMKYNRDTICTHTKIKKQMRCKECNKLILFRGLIRRPIMDGILITQMQQLLYKPEASNINYILRQIDELGIIVNSCSFTCNFRVTRVGNLISTLPSQYTMQQIVKKINMTGIPACLSVLFDKKVRSVGVLIIYPHNHAYLVDPNGITEDKLVKNSIFEQRVASTLSKYEIKLINQVNWFVKDNPTESADVKSKYEYKSSNNVITMLILASLIVDHNIKPMEAFDMMYKFKDFITDAYKIVCPLFAGYKNIQQVEIVKSA